MSDVVRWEPDTAPLGEAVVAIGVFDGVHLGHQALIGHAAADGAMRGLPCVAVTFDRDPDQVVTPDAPAPQLLTLADKCRFLTAAGADRVLVVPFDTDLAALSPESFLERVLLAALEPHAVHVGVDFRFGHFAEGNVGTLRSAGEDFGFDVVAHDLVTSEGAPVTSTRIRTHVRRGEVDKAAALLGREHRVSGIVVRGRGAGVRDLGVPTANLLPVEHAALPADGVYAGWASLDARSRPAAVSVGLPPTFPGAHDRLEVHLLDLDEDLYGRNLTVGFTRRLRAQTRFDSHEQLSAAIKRDIEEVRRTS
jgi:riboflavin kinase/FMN adenylyltransferase